MLKTAADPNLLSKMQSKIVLGLLSFQTNNSTSEAAAANPLMRMWLILIPNLLKMRPEIKVPMMSAIEFPIVKEIKSPGTFFNWKLIKKKQKATVLRIIVKQMKFLLIYQMEQISEMVPLSLII